MSTVRFTVPGIPQQQGSKTKMPNGAMVEANKKLAGWRSTAIEKAVQARGRVAPLTGPVSVIAVAYFPRPKSHYGRGSNAATLRADAPVAHSSPPDLDKIARAIGDVLTQSRVIDDDRLICEWVIRKMYAADEPHTAVFVETVA